MDDVLTIEEKYSKYWTYITIGLTGLTILFLALYSNAEGTVLKGYLKLIAFAGLAATVLSALKVMQGRHSVQLKIEDNNILLSYYRRNQKVDDDVFELNSIKSLKVNYPQSNIFDALFVFNNPVLIVEFKDSDRTLNLIEVNSRPLPLSMESVQIITRYISDHTSGIDIQKSDNELLNKGI